MSAHAYSGPSVALTDWLDHELRPMFEDSVLEAHRARGRASALRGRGCARCSRRSPVESRFPYPGLVHEVGFVAQTDISVTKARSSISSIAAMAWAMSAPTSMRGLKSRRRDENSVCTSLGLICITRTFDLRSSARQHSVIPCSANLLATYAVPPSTPRCA